jgi:hypothetical protein
MTSPETIDKVLHTIAEGFRVSLRSPVLHTPAEHGLDYERELPVRRRSPPRRLVHSSRRVRQNHHREPPPLVQPLRNPSHLEPWKSLGGSAGNDFEVNLVPDYKILHDAGYHVLAYDLRNFGQSGAANGGNFTVGRFESRDVLSGR